MTRFHALLIGALAPCLLSACSILPWGRTFELEVVGGDLGGIEALYVIVGGQELAKAKNETAYELVESTKHASYRTFAHFEPVHKVEWVWEEAAHSPHSDLVTIEPADDEPRLSVEIDKRDLLESFPQSMLVLVMSNDKQEWKLHPISRDELDKAGEMRIRVGPGGFEVQAAK